MIKVVRQTVLQANVFIENYGFYIEVNSSALRGLKFEYWEILRPLLFETLSAGSILDI